MILGKGQLLDRALEAARRNVEGNTWPTVDPTKIITWPEDDAAPEEKDEG